MPSNIAEIPALLPQGLPSQALAETGKIYVLSYDKTGQPGVASSGGGSALGGGARVQCERLARLERTRIGTQGTCAWPHLSVPLAEPRPVYCLRQQVYRGKRRRAGLRPYI